MTPIKKAKKVMSGKTTADRIREAEKGAMKSKVKAKAKPKAKKTPVYKPKQKHVDARKAKIRAAREADRKAIAAMRKKKGK